MKIACEVAAWLRENGRSVSIVSAHTLKPLDIDGVAQALHSHKHVMVIEELAPYGGLGPRVKAIAWDTKASCRMDTFALDDAFHHVYGSHGDILAAHGLSREAIIAKLEAE